MSSPLSSTTGISNTAVTISQSTQGSAGIASLLSLLNVGFGNSAFSYMSSGGVLHEQGR